MEKLNLPKYTFKIKNRENKLYIFDIIRKKYVVLSPEEWVRQHFLNYLIIDKKYPKSIIAIEKQLNYNGLVKRTDILVFDKQGQPDIIVECKSPRIKISQEAFDQIARYNLRLDANFLIVTNGIQHYYCQLDHRNEQYVFLEEIPEYS
jgi:hypothetical protein